MEQKLQKEQLDQYRECKHEYYQNTIPEQKHREREKVKVSLTEEQLKKRRQKSKKYYQKLTPEQKEMRRQYSSKYYKTITPEQIERRRQNASKYYERMTPEQREMRNRCQRVRKLKRQKSEKLLTTVQTPGNDRKHSHLKRIKLEPNEQQYLFQSVSKSIKTEPNEEQNLINEQFSLECGSIKIEHNPENTEKDSLKHHLIPIKIEYNPVDGEQRSLEHRLDSIKAAYDQKNEERTKSNMSETKEEENQHALSETLDLDKYAVRRKQLLVEYKNGKIDKSELLRLRSQMYYEQYKIVGKKQIYTEEQMIQQRQRCRELYRKMSPQRKEQLRQYRQDYRRKIKAEKEEKKRAEIQLETEKHKKMQSSEQVNRIRLLMQEFYKKMTPEEKKQRIQLHREKRIQKQKELISLMLSAKLKDIKGNRMNRRNFCYTCRVQYLDTVSLMDHIIKHVTSPTVALFRIDNFINRLCSQSKPTTRNTQIDTNSNSNNNSINLANVKQEPLIEYERDVEIKFEPQDIPVDVKLEPEIKSEPGNETDIEIDQSYFYTYTKKDEDTDYVKLDHEYL